jgi:hypothetical protein
MRGFAVFRESDAKTLHHAQKCGMPTWMERYCLAGLFNDNFPPVLDMISSIFVVCKGGGEGKLRGRSDNKRQVKERSLPSILKMLHASTETIV